MVSGVAGERAGRRAESPLRRVSKVRVEAGNGDPGWRLTGMRPDEILPNERGCTHEVAFIQGGIKVTCVDLEAAWDS